MNTPIKTLACAAVASIAFFACDDTGTNVNSSGNNPCKVKVLSKTCNDERCWYDDSDSAFFRPYDPNWVDIREPVKEWMEEQLATGSNDTRLFTILDYFIENSMSLFDIEGYLEHEYYVNGKRVGYEEYLDSAKKQEEYLRESKIKGKRDLPISKELIHDIYSDTVRMYKGVPMTAKEIVELTENYKQLIIEFTENYDFGTDDGDNAGSLPPCD